MRIALIVILGILGVIPAQAQGGYGMDATDIIAVTLDCGDSQPLYLIRRDETGYTATLFHRDGGTNLAWSPDGSQLTWRNKDGLHRAFIENPDLTFGTLSSTLFGGTWSPTGNFFGYQRIEGQIDLALVVVDQDGKWVNKIPKTHTERLGLSFSPDDLHVAYINVDGHLTIARIDNAEVVRVIEDYQAAQPSWSPDGRHLLFMTYNEDGTLSQFIMDVYSETNSLEGEIQPFMDMQPIDSEPLVWDASSSWVAYIGKSGEQNTLFIADAYMPQYAFPISTDHPIHLWNWKARSYEVAVSTTLDDAEGLELYTVHKDGLYAQITEADVDILSAAWRPYVEEAEAQPVTLSPDPAPIKLSCDA